MIISCSRRTDVPAFYTRWLLGRLEAGFCTTVNPYNARQVSRVSLAPGDVDAIVFWTKNPAPLVPHLESLRARGYRYYFLVTITGYGRELEPAVPPWQEVAARCEEIVRVAGPGTVVWRYDPILLSPRLDAAHHRATFERIARRLDGVAERVVVSVLDRYRKTVRNLERLRAPADGARHPDPDRERLVPYREPETLPVFADTLRALAEIAGERGLEIQSCAETRDLARFGIEPGKCIDDRLLHRLYGITVPATKDGSQRAACRCTGSRDIGAYDTCRHGCLYCYATGSMLGEREHHDDSPSLVGRFEPTEDPAGEQLGLPLDERD